MRILAVDPSVNNVGLALYDTETKRLQTHTHHPPNRKGKGGETQEMSHMMAGVFRFIYISLLQGKKIDKLVVEYPNWQGSERGLIAAQQGYTLDLAFIAGHLASSFGLTPSNIYLPTPSQWKGNAPKAATQARVQRMFGTLQIDEHAYDAVGMIMWLMKQLAI